MRCRDGSLKWVIDSGKKAQDADGNWMVNSLYLDITRSEEAAQKLREQTQLLTSIYDTVPCGIIRFMQCRDEQYRLISLNKAALSLMGYDSLEGGMNDWHEGTMGAVLPEDKSIIQETYHQMTGVGDCQEIEYRVRWKDGSIHWMNATNMVVDTTPDGEKSFREQWWISLREKRCRSVWTESRRCTALPWKQVLPLCLNI